MASESPPAENKTAHVRRAALARPSADIAQLSTRLLWFGPLRRWFPPAARSSRLLSLDGSSRHGRQGCDKTCEIPWQRESYFRGFLRRSSVYPSVIRPNAVCRKSVPHEFLAVCGPFGGSETLASARPRQARTTLSAPGRARVLDFLMMRSRMIFAARSWSSAALMSHDARRSCSVT